MEIVSLPNRNYTSWSKSYINLGEYNINSIISSIGQKKIIVRGYNGEPYKVKASSTRLQVFKKNLTCVKCSKEGNIFLLQTPRQPPRPLSFLNCFIKDCPWCCYNDLKYSRFTTPHLNLWHRGKGNELTLMTQDHIYPKSKGGSDKLENLQTMCRRCNNKKGDSI